MRHSRLPLKIGTLGIVAHFPIARNVIADDVDLLIALWVIAAGEAHLLLLWFGRPLLGREDAAGLPAFLTLRIFQSIRDRDATNRGTMAIASLIHSFFC